jgi:hypothetical protein
VFGSLYRFPPQLPKVSVVGFAGGEIIVAASALEKGLKVLLLIPPLAEASRGAINIRIAMTAKAMPQPFS